MSAKSFQVDQRKQALRVCGRCGAVFTVAVKLVHIASCSNCGGRTHEAFVPNGHNKGASQPEDQP